MNEHSLSVSASICSVKVCGSCLLLPGVHRSMNAYGTSQLWTQFGPVRVLTGFSSHVGLWGSRIGYTTETLGGHTTCPSRS